MDKNKTLTEAANDLIEHAMEQGIPGRMIPFVEALRVAKNERKAESESARLEIASLKAKNLELERICDATYVTQGADAYNHACSIMEQYQAEREAARKEVGTESSLCDGISWLYTRIASLESQLEDVGTGGDVQPYDQQAMGLCHGCGWKGVIDYPDGPVCVACEHDKTLPPQPTAQALHVAATSCPHEIDKDKIVLHFDSKQPGKNALAQLASRLQAAQVVPAPGVEAVSEREFKQFLSDVLTAAGLVTHGKKCKDLGRRLGEMSMRLLTAPKTTTNTAAVETMRAAIGQLLNEFGERQWQSGRGVPHKSLEEAFDAIIERAALATPAQPVAWLHDCAALLTNDVELWIDACPHCGKPHNAPQPVAVPAAGPVGFDHKTAANFLNGKTVTDEEVRRFVAHSRWAHDDRDGLRNTIADLRREIAQRDAEIALLKTSLLDAESPTQAAQVLDAARVFWQQHTKSDALSMTMAELHADVELVIRAARGAAQAAPVDAAVKPAINVGTIGHVGSGKTTLIAALGKLIAAQKGNHD